MLWLGSQLLAANRASVKLCSLLQTLFTFMCAQLDMYGRGLRSDAYSAGFPLDFVGRFACEGLDDERGVSSGRRGIWAEKGKKDSRVKRGGGGKERRRGDISHVPR